MNCLRTSLLSFLLSFVLVACDAEPAATPEPEITSSISCDSDNGGLILEEGFCASVFADTLGRARHIAVAPNGDVYVKLRREMNGGSIVALRDSDADGKADEIRYFGNPEWGGTGIEVHNGYLYYSSDVAVYRQELDENALVPTSPVETIARGFGAERQHAAKSLAFDDEGGLYVNVGAPSNACQVEARTESSPGQDPCPMLEEYGGVWRFDADAQNQDQMRDGYRYVTGTRNIVALAWNPFAGKLSGVMHGRDQLSQLWPELYTTEQSADLPAEEFLSMEEGDDFGWPYCYYDQNQERKVLAPEYGGDGRAVQRCIDKKAPIFGFPAHYAPNDLLFYGGDVFPGQFSGGAFIAFHGSWNRAPEPQAGFAVVFAPMEGDRVTDEWSFFATGFTGKEGPVINPGEAEYRPTGLAQGPDGSLFVSDSVKGRIWMIVYSG